MTALKFIGDIHALAAGVRRGQLKRISSDFSHYGCLSATLWLTSGEGFRLTCRMQELADQVTVGVLQIELITQAPREETTVDLPWSFRSGGGLSKLVIEQNGVQVESGILVRSVDGDEVIIVAAAYPHRLYIKGANAPQQEVTPEYSLNRYIQQDA